MGTLILRLLLCNQAQGTKLSDLLDNKETKRNSSHHSSPSWQSDNLLREFDMLSQCQNIAANLEIKLKDIHLTYNIFISNH